MINARKIAANRRNAQKSTGPRSIAGKSRSSCNSLRHGLSAARSAPSRQYQQQVEQLTRKIAGEGADPLTFEQARTAAEVQLRLLHIRRIRMAFIDRMATVGSFFAPDGAKLSARDAWNLTNACLLSGFSPRPPDDEANVPKEEEAERTAEAIRRALPELAKLDRFEKRALARRDQALGLIRERLRADTED